MVALAYANLEYFGFGFFIALLQASASLLTMFYNGVVERKFTTLTMGQWKKLNISSLIRRIPWVRENYENCG